jgi:hypothetical protein
MCKQVPAVHFEMLLINLLCGDHPSRRNRS